MTAIRFENVAHGYPGRKLFSGFTLDIPEGASLAVVGRNGAGKSTLLALAAGIVRPQAGTVWRQGKAALVLQGGAVPERLPLTAGEAVAMGRWPRLGLLRRAGAADRQAVYGAMDRLEVLDLAGVQMGELSGGQRQRVLVAQGLAQEAQILLLDEPAAGLDLHTQACLRNVIAEEVACGRTVVQATHSTADAGAADAVLQLGAADPAS